MPREVRPRAPGTRLRIAILVAGLGAVSAGVLGALALNQHGAWSEDHRADRRADDQVAQDRRQPHEAAQHHDDDRRGEQHENEGQRMQHGVTDRTNPVSPEPDVSTPAPGVGGRAVARDASGTARRPRPLYLRR